MLSPQKQRRETNTDHSVMYPVKIWTITKSRFSDRPHNSTTGYKGQKGVGGEVGTHACHIFKESFIFFFRSMSLGPVTRVLNAGAAEP